MTLDPRVDRLETATVTILSVLERHERLLDRIVQVQEQQAGTLRDMVRLLGSIDDRLGHVEEYLRPPGQNGDHP